MSNIISMGVAMPMLQYLADELSIEELTAQQIYLLAETVEPSSDKYQEIQKAALNMDIECYYNLFTSGGNHE